MPHLRCNAVYRATALTQILRQKLGELTAEGQVQAMIAAVAYKHTLGFVHGCPA